MCNRYDTDMEPIWNGNGTGRPAGASAAGSQRQVRTAFAEAPPSGCYNSPPRGGSAQARRPLLSPQFCSLKAALLRSARRGRPNLGYNESVTKEPLPANDPVAADLVQAIRSGDVESLKRLLVTHPGLASARLQGERGGVRTPLHVAADWPGHFPNGRAVVAALLVAGADPNARVEGAWHTETPLHWAASSGDLAMLDALLDGGAEIELDGASIAGGTAMDDAVGYGQFHVARRLVERGGRTKLWHAAALGLMDRVQEYFAGPVPPAQAEVTMAFWQACHGGQLVAAQFLLARGANINWLPDWSPKTPLDIAQVSNPGRPPADDLVRWLREQGAKSASELAHR